MIPRIWREKFANWLLDGIKIHKGIATGNKSVTLSDMITIGGLPQTPTLTGQIGMKADGVAQVFSGGAAKDLALDENVPFDWGALGYWMAVWYEVNNAGGPPLAGAMFGGAPFRFPTREGNLHLPIASVPSGVQLDAHCTIKIINSTGGTIFKRLLTSHPGVSVKVLLNSVDISGGFVSPTIDISVGYAPGLNTLELIVLGNELVFNPRMDALTDVFLDPSLTFLP